MFPEWILTNGENLTFAVFFALMFVLAAFERWLPRRAAAEARVERWRANLALTGINFLVLSAQPISLLAVAAWAQGCDLGLLNVVALPAAALLLANLLLRGFISFATHYLMHKLPAFWRLHRVHHLDTELDVSTTVRFHPLEFLVSTLPAAPMVIVFGLTPWALMLYEVLDAAINVFSHSNIRIPRSIDRIVRYFIVTPDLHRIHHSTWQPETDSNFSAVFPVWDMLFGTFRGEPREAHETMRLGLDEVRGTNATGVSWLLKSPLLERIGDA